MLSPSQARSLVNGLEPFALGRPNWRVTYNHRREAYSIEARSAMEVVGALNFACPTAAIAACNVLRYTEVLDTVLEHPLKRLFDYDVDMYEYNPNVDNYGIQLNHGLEAILYSCRGIQPVGAFFFPRGVAQRYVDAINTKEIIL